jgi:hypothetical protein
VAIMRKVILFVVALVFFNWNLSSQTGVGRSNDLYEVKNSTFFADGTLDEYLVTEWANRYAYIDNQKKYSASGAILEKVEFAYNTDKGWNSSKITRDVEDHLKNRIVYQYNEQGKLWRESLVDNKGKVVSTYEYGYDNKGNQISRAMKNRSGDKLAETTYTYDSNGKMLTSETRDSKDNKISSTKYNYDSQGNLINQQVFNGAGQVTSVINSVFQEGREVKNERASPDGTVQMRITNEYGRDGELNKKTIENFQGSSKQVIQYEYQKGPRRTSSS